MKAWVLDGLVQPTVNLTGAVQCEKLAVESTLKTLSKDCDTLSVTW